MNRQTLQTIEVAKRADGHYVLRTQSVGAVPALPVQELDFDSLQDAWRYLGEWFLVCADAADLVDAGVLRVIVP